MSLRSYADQVFEEDEAAIRSRFSSHEKLEAVERELRYRRNVYGRRVSEGRMTQALADRQISLFESIAADYRKDCRRERLL